VKEEKMLIPPRIIAGLLYYTRFGTKHPTDSKPCKNTKKEKLRRLEESSSHV